jgi:predicted amidophosphoribosyltransferase
VCLACLATGAGAGTTAGAVGTARRRCASCGQRVGTDGRCATAWCRRADRGWSVVFSLGDYAGGLRRAILRYKYGRERWWAGVFGCLVAGWLDEHAGWVEEFDILTAVPAYAGPDARRPWDAVGGVLNEVARLTPGAWEVAAGAVRKRTETPPMSGAADRGARRQTASGALRRALWVPDPGLVAGRRVLVLDDVLAEGSTLREVATSLRRAGAREVAGLVLARAAWADAGPSAGRRARGPVGRGGRPGDR